MADETIASEEEKECIFNFDNLSEVLVPIIDCPTLTESYKCLVTQKASYDRLLLELLVVPDADEIIPFLFSYNNIDVSEVFDLSTIGVTDIGFYNNLSSDFVFNSLDDIYALSRQFFKEPSDTTTGSGSNTRLVIIEHSVGDTGGAIERVSEYAAKRYKTFKTLYELASADDSNIIIDNKGNIIAEYDASSLQQIALIANKIMQVVIPSLAEAGGGKAAKCAAEIALIEENMIRFAAENIGLVATGRGYGDLSLSERVQLGENLAIALPSTSSPAGSDIGVQFTSNLQTFKEQCIFLSQMFHLVDKHKKVEEEKETEGTYIYPYTGTKPDSNASLIVEGEPFNFINQLTQYPSTGNFFEATNAQIAHLQPMIRLFKITPSNGSEKSYEFKFDTFASPDDIREVFSNKNKRGFGAGIKSFNFTYDGSNPFSIKKSIKASLTIHANNFSELLKQRGNIRYIDLALKTGTAIRERTGDPELDFRIKAVVGLSVPNGKTTANFSDIMDAVKENYVTLNLTPVTHTFDFDETGAVTFKVEYYAYIEEFLDKARMNIFADNTLSKRVTERRLAYKTAKSTCKDQQSIDKLNELLDLDSQNILNDKKESLQFITKQLQKNNLIYFLSLTNSQIQQIKLRGPFYANQTKGQIINPTDTGLNANTVAADLDAQWNAYVQQTEQSSNSNGLNVSFRLSALNSNQFAFFYLGDLLNVILSIIPQNLKGLEGNIENSYIPKGSEAAALSIDTDLIDQEKRLLKTTYEKFKKFRFLLGPIEIVDHATKKEVRRVSLADLPISLAYFNEWLTSKLLAKDEAEYPLTQFLNDLMNNFVKNYLNDDSCYPYDIKQRVRVFQNCLTSYGDDINDNITKHLESKKETRLSLSLDQHDDLRRPILQPAGPRDFNLCQYGPEREYHFFIYYAGRVQPSDLMTGDRCVDHPRGLFHYTLGKDRGIVKSIQLQKDETPGLKEVRFEQEGFDGLRQLREIYNVNIKTVANVSTFPGTYIYVEPRGFSPNLGSYDIDKFDLTDLGIGGYYMIINSTHEFAAGTMETSFNARWVQSLDHENPEDETETTSGDVSPKKCTITVVP